MLESMDCKLGTWVTNHVCGTTIRYKHEHDPTRTHKISAHIRRTTCTGIIPSSSRNIIPVS